MTNTDLLYARLYPIRAKYDTFDEMSEILKKDFFFENNPKEPKHNRNEHALKEVYEKFSLIQIHIKMVIINIVNKNVKTCMNSKKCPTFFSYSFFFFKTKECIIWMYVFIYKRMKSRIPLGSEWLQFAWNLSFRFYVLCNLICLAYVSFIKCLVYISFIETHDGRSF